ncbi:MAG: DUF3300 domain-containing protein [bacterium]|nr:DUF3300 domain-containing protein [bacterium]
MKHIFIIILSLFLLNTFGFSQMSEDEKFEAKHYDNAKVVRVKFAQGEAFIQRSFEEGLEEASINLPVFEKDLVGTTEGRLELYLGRLNYVRMDYDTEMNFEQVPELRRTDLKLRVLKGGVYLDVEGLDNEKDVEIQTADCGIFLLEKGIYRINVTEGGGTEVFVREGVAEVSGRDYSRRVKEGQKMVMFDGKVKARPFYFDSSDTDGFDTWNKQRNHKVGYAKYSSSRYLDRGYEDQEYELSRNGRWVYKASYGSHIWIPYNVGNNWRPYSHGRWVWTPHYGYVWSSYDTCGAFTHHYGRWHWDSYHHWYWTPGYSWSPAWVHWFWDDHHYGWCPLSRWNRPVIVMNNRWVRRPKRLHGIPLSARSSVLVRKGHLRASSVRKVALNKNSIHKMQKKSFKLRGPSPKFKPAVKRINVVNARGKHVSYRNNGFLNMKKYTPTSSVSGLKNGKVYRYSGEKTAKKVFKYSSADKMSAKKRVNYKGTSGKNSYRFKSKTTKVVKSPSSTSGRYKSDTPKGTTSYRYKTKKSSSTPSSSRYKSSKSSSDSSSRYKTKKSSSSSSSSSRYKSKKSTSSKSSKSSSSTTKVRKKKDSPSYSYSSTPSSSKSNRYSSSSSKSKSYSSSPSASTSYRYKSSKASSSSSKYKSRTGSSSSYSRPKYKSRTSSSSSSYKSSSRPSSSSSYKSSSRPSSSSSYKSSSRPSSSYKSHTRKSSSSSSKSYSRPSRSSKSSGSSKSYSRKSSSSSSKSSKSSSSSSGSSSKARRKK